MAPKKTRLDQYGEKLDDFVKGAKVKLVESQDNVSDKVIEEIGDVEESRSEAASNVKEIVKSVHKKHPKTVNEIVKYTLGAATLFKIWDTLPVPSNMKEAAINTINTASKETANIIMDNPGYSALACGILIATNPKGRKVTKKLAMKVLGIASDAIYNETAEDEVDRVVREDLEREGRENAGTDEEVRRELEIRNGERFFTREELIELFKE